MRTAAEDVWKRIQLAVESMSTQIVPGKLDATDLSGFDSAPETTANEEYYSYVSGEAANLGAIAVAAGWMAKSLEEVAEIMDKYYEDAADLDQDFWSSAKAILFMAAGFLVFPDPTGITKVVAIILGVLDFIYLLWNVLTGILPNLLAILTATLPSAPFMPANLAWSGVPRP
jgi:hypothetical protein